MLTYLLSIIFMTAVKKVERFQFSEDTHFSISSKIIIVAFFLDEIFSMCSKIDELDTLNQSVLQSSDVAST